MRCRSARDNHASSAWPSPSLETVTPMAWSDEYEEANGLDPNVNDAALDRDGDGLTNLTEHDLNTLANRRDSDGTGGSMGLKMPSDGSLSGGTQRYRQTRDETDCPPPGRMRTSGRFPAWPICVILLCVGIPSLRAQFSGLLAPTHLHGGSASVQFTTSDPNATATEFHRGLPASTARGLRSPRTLTK